MLSLSIFALASVIAIAKQKSVKKEPMDALTYTHPWSPSDFRKNAHDMVDYMCQYYETLETKPVMSTVEPGYLSKLLPSEAPQNGETWDKIFSDVESKILPGVTHWQHPSFFAYFPANVSYPGMMGEILSGMFNVIGFSWICSPACTELETIVMDWLCKAIGLPDHFLSTGKGGGVIQSTASESTLVSLLAARTKSIKSGAKSENLVVYMSDQTHSSVQKACMIAGISNIRILASDKDCRLDPKVVLEQIKDDLSHNLTPCFLCATLGTTSTSACDPLDLIGPICEKYDIWMHIDSAYAGAAFLCDEFRHHLKGIDFANTFSFNPHKWMLTNFECSTMWVKDRKYLLDALDITPEYLRNKASESGLVIDYRSWQVPLGRRFRSLKLWFVLRSYGIKGLQEYIRFHVALAKYFEDFITHDDRFELSHERNFSLVCFRLRNQSNETNKKFLEMINGSGKLYLVHSEVKKVYFLRMAIGGTFTTEKHVQGAIESIQTLADKMKKFSSSTTPKICLLEN